MTRGSAAEGTAALSVPSTSSNRASRSQNSGFSIWRDTKDKMVILDWMGWKKKEEQDKEQAVSVNITDVHEGISVSLSLKTIVLRNKNIKRKMTLKKRNRGHLLDFFLFL